MDRALDKFIINPKDCKKIMKKVKRWKKSWKGVRTHTIQFDKIWLRIDVIKPTDEEWEVLPNNKK